MVAMFDQRRGERKWTRESKRAQRALDRSLDSDGSILAGMLAAMRHAEAKRTRSSPGFVYHDAIRTRPRRLTVKGYTQKGQSGARGRCVIGGGSCQRHPGPAFCRASS